MDIDALNDEDLDTPIGVLRVALQPGGWVAVERLDPYDPEMRQPVVIHTLDHRGPFGAVWGKRRHELQATKEMYRKRTEREDQSLAAESEALLSDQERELQKLIRRDSDLLPILLGWEKY